MAHKYAGLQTLLARNPDGSDNAPGDVGEAGDAYLRITDPKYVSNASDAGGPNGMPLPVTPTDDFSGFLAGLPPPAAAFFTTILDFEGRPAGGPPANAPDILVGNMPQARAISDAVMAAGTTNIPNSAGVNEWFDFFGQLLTHDVAEAATAASGDLPLLIDGLPFPFARTPFEIDSDGVRQQHNEETSFLDLSMVYGNSQAREDLARVGLDSAPEQSAKLLLGADGLLPTIKEIGIDSGHTSLEVLQIFTEPGFAGLPDPAAIPAPADATFENLFYAGDNRVNQQPPLIALQTVWAREHNYQVDQLTPHATAQDWTQDQLFEAARAISEAEFQHIVYNEYVPTLIGTHADELLATYRWSHPGPIDPGIINEWTTVAFRFGHDQSSNDFTLLNADHTEYLPTPITLGAAFALAGAAADVPGAGHSAADLDAWIRGLTSQFAQETDGLVGDGNRNVLFGIGTTVDLNAFDIQRGRDHGVWNYNALREGLALATYASFAEFGWANGIEGDRLDALSNVYGGDITKLDSIVGGLLEKNFMDSQLGETFTLLNAIQFAAIKEGDQFYYENRLADNPELLAEIKGVTFAEITDRNSGADHLNLDTFHIANRMELTKWNDTKYGADDANYLKADLMIGGDGNDKLYGKSGVDTLYGDAGKDRLDGGYGGDFLKAGSGDDSAYGGAGNDYVWGEDGKDYISLDGGNDWADGGYGNDTIYAGDGNDIALGKEGNDSLYGGKGYDELFGGYGKDTVKGEDGDDMVYGGDGNDYVAGGKGNDLINGGYGNDLLNGGAGYDTFVFEKGSGYDKIEDFNIKQDYIDLSDYEQFESVADLQVKGNWKKSYLDLGDSDSDGSNDVIELVGVSKYALDKINIKYHEEPAVEDAVEDAVVALDETNNTNPEVPAVV